MNEDEDAEFEPHVDPVPPPLEIWWQEESEPVGNEKECEDASQIRWTEE